MMTSTWRCWLGRLSGTSPGGWRPASRPPRSARPRLEALEDRTLPSVTIAPSNNSGNGYVGLTIDKTAPLDGGFVPPDTQGAAVPSEYVQSANLTYAIFSPKATGTTSALRGIQDFFTNASTGGGLPRAGASSSFSDPVVVYDEYIGKFVLAVQDTTIQTGGGPSAFDIAVSTSNNPATLTKSDWKFNQIITTETGNLNSDYPGNLGYNNDALVFTLNQFNASETAVDHVLVTAISQADLAAGSATPKVRQADFSGQSLRPTTMHNSVAGDPMWLVEEATPAGSGGSTINVVEMTKILTSPTFTTTPLSVTPYSEVRAPLQPNGAAITTNIDSRIQKAAYNVVSGVDTLVAAQAVSNAAGDRDMIQWYRITISGGVPTLADQGRVDTGAGTYDVYPALDITPSGTIGMGYSRSGTDAGDFMSGFITGRTASDPAGTMETPVLIPAGKGTVNDTLDGREGDLSGINIDPVDGSFWTSQEFATPSSRFGQGSWGEAIANFTVPTADLALTGSGPATANEGDNNLTYTFTVTNGGPDAAPSTVLTDTLGANLTFVSATTSQGTFTQSGSTVTFNLGTIANGGSATVTVTA
jgi:uncharacterized repeat protein (TIGR01451 family)